MNTTSNNSQQKESAAENSDMTYRTRRGSICRVKVDFQQFLLQWFPIKPQINNSTLSCRQYRPHDKCSMCSLVYTLSTITRILRELLITANNLAWQGVWRVQDKSQSTRQIRELILTSRCRCCCRRVICSSSSVVLLAHVSLRPVIATNKSHTRHSI